jgi:hypothetical protein
MGGLGNQMLQYALGRNMSIKYDSPLWLEFSWFDYNRDLQFARVCNLDKFNTQHQCVNFNNVVWKLRFTPHFKDINPFKLKIIKEIEYGSFDPSILEAGDNIILEGLFPSYKYFEGIRKLLLKDFTPCLDMDSVNLECLNDIVSSNSVSVHFRRGDYAHTGHHRMLDKTYYEAAIKYIEERKEALKLFIFSDEPEWVLQNMHFNHPYKIINFNKDDKNYFDMELMKHCKHNIIANSTFSWWGAWLNENPGKMVVAPADWSTLEINKMQNIPSDWIIL